MNLQHLEYFITIAETNNFTSASTILSVTQPALSKAISKLEEELEVPLFKKKGRNIEITPFGEVFLTYAKLSLNHIEKGIEEIKHMKQETEKNISISYTDCIGTSFIPFIISSFLSIHPDIKFQFNPNSVDEILTKLKFETYDLGFLDDITCLEKYPELEATLVSKEKYVVVTPKSHPLSNRTEISLSELENEQFIVYGNHCENSSISYTKFIDYTPKIAMQPNQASMLVGLVAAGVGITILPNTPMIHTNKISILNIKEDIGHKSIYMVWNKNTVQPGIVEAFRTHILSVYHR
ncbi:MAG: LysR family transcriptional regulator [Turicibacter sp.]